MAQVAAQTYAYSDVYNLTLNGLLPNRDAQQKAAAQYEKFNADGIFAMHLLSVLVKARNQG